nr:pentatricopeptide repeat-containing protein, mitochondrial [Quercus suber]
MRAFDTPIDQFTIPMVVSTCAELMLLDHGKNIHGLVLKLGLFAGNSAVGSSFVYMYVKCAQIDDAYLMFDEMCVRDMVAWTVLVIGYVQNNESEKGLECLCEMHRVGGDGERPTFRTLEGGFQACGNLGALVEGRCLHGLIVKTGIGCSQVVQSSLLSMYSKCGIPGEAYRSFCEVTNKDLLSWTSLIGIYSRFGLMAEGLSLFLEMQENEIYPDGIVISSILLGFGNSMIVSEGKAFHGLIIRQHYVLDMMVHNALLSMYCKFGLLSLAEKLFRRVAEANKDSWNNMIFGYGKAGLEAKCIELFREMQWIGIEPDSNSLVSMVSSCSQLGATYLGRSIHCYIIKHSMDENVMVVSSLMDMYAIAGNLNIAWKIFCGTQRDIITWNTLISSYAYCGHYAEAVALFEEMISENLQPNSATLMEKSNVKPNGLTFLALLSACTHAGLVKEGKCLFNRMQDYSIKPNLKHYSCMIDLLARSGNLQEAEALVLSMPFAPDGGVWGALLSACKIHNEIETGVRIAKYAIETDPENDGYYIMMCNMFNSVGRWEEAERHCCCTTVAHWKANFVGQASNLNKDHERDDGFNTCQVFCIKCGLVQEAELYSKVKDEFDLFGFAYKCKLSRRPKISQKFIKLSSFLLPTVFTNRCSGYLMLLTSRRKTLNIILNISLRKATLISQASNLNRDYERDGAFNIC